MIAVSATRTGRPRARIRETPITRWPGLSIDDAANLLERDREIARHAGHHRVGVALRDHRGGEKVAVLVDHALAVAQQEAAAAAAARRGIARRARCVRKPRVVDLDALFREIEAGLLGDRAHAILAPDQDRRAETLIDERIGGADDLLFLALGEHDALGHAAHALDDALHGAGDRIAARR